MIIAPLCSSSSANSTFVGDVSKVSKNTGNLSECGILVDIGCSYRALCRYLALSAIDLSAIKALLITHEHSDHVRGLPQFTKKNDIPIFASKGTCEALLEKDMVYNPDRLFSLDDLDEDVLGIGFSLKAFNTSHDSAQSVGFTVNCESTQCKIAYMTDLGEVTPEVRKATLGADSVFIESNYEPELLRKNTNYPYYLKQRIESCEGHLSNIDSADYIRELVENGATKIILGHLSRENNTPQTAFFKVTDRLSQAGLQIKRDYTLNIAGIETAGEYIAV